MVYRLILTKSLWINLRISLVNNVRTGEVEMFFQLNVTSCNILKIGEHTKTNEWTDNWALLVNDWRIERYFFHSWKEQCISLEALVRILILPVFYFYFFTYLLVYVYNVYLVFEKFCLNFLRHNHRNPDVNHDYDYYDLPHHRHHYHHVIVTGNIFLLPTRTYTQRGQTS